MNIYVIGPRDEKPLNGEVINTTSRSRTWSRSLSPFFLGPCKLYDSNVGKNVENSYQYCKVYKCHLNDYGEPNASYFEWRDKGWADHRANRYPMGKGSKPEYSYWLGCKLSYIEARKEIYIPIYYEAVRHTPAFTTLQMEYLCGDKDIYLWDFDGYNHKELGMTYDEVVNCETKKMGHAFVLAMILEGKIEKYV